MEFLTIFLSGLITVVSGVGFILDKVIESNIRSQLSQVEQLQVRVNNTPNYQILPGKVDQVLIAGKGLWLTPDIRIGVLELETDPIDLDIEKVRKGGKDSLANSLRQPLQAGVRLVLTESDINQALESPEVIELLSDLINVVISRGSRRYKLLNSQVDFLDDNRIYLQVTLQQGDNQPLEIILNSGVGILTGKSIQLIEPKLSVDGNPLPPQLIKLFVGSLSQRLNLSNIEDEGITARILKFQLNPSELELAAFVRIKE
ncbi:MAG: DUF2993 domain-containing protein [Moorea sp. SIO3G5]|nr:DUF2993 domain-containing protein [Moorena sp. SIO3G5]